MKLILASSSPRRRELLLSAGFEFITENPDCDESGITASADRLVAELSRRKAEAVFAMHQDCCVLGADTVVALDGKILGKPANDEAAFEMLRSLSGKKHTVYTGVCVMFTDNGRKACDCRVSETDVFFREISDGEIRAYIATGEPSDKAGAYGIQGRGGDFVKKIRGSRSNVIGLPVSTVINMLEKAGIKVN